MSLLTIAQAEPTVHQSSHDSIQPTRWGGGEEEKKRKKERKRYEEGGEKEKRRKARRIALAIRERLTKAKFAAHFIAAR